MIWKYTGAVDLAVDKSLGLEVGEKECKDSMGIILLRWVSYTPGRFLEGGSTPRPDSLNSCISWGGFCMFYNKMYENPSYFPGK